MSTRILCRIDHTLHYLITLLVSAKEPIWYSRSQTSNLNLIKSKNMAFIKRAFRSSILSHLVPYSLQHWWSDASPPINCGCLLHVPRRPSLRFMSSNTSRWLLPRTHLHPQLFLYSSSFAENPIAVFSSPFRRSNHSSWPAKTTDASARRRKSRKRICRWTNVSGAWGEIDISCLWWWTVLTHLQVCCEW